jgi:uncharacterized protein (TIGR03435 family)
MTRYLFVGLALTTAVGFAQAQSPQGSFEVVSVKRSPEGASMTRPGSPGPGGRWLAQNATLLMVLQRAYPDYELPGMIVGGPSWIREAKFDIDARAGREVPRGEYPALVQRLLADRFTLKVHTEPRVLDVYALVPGRGDGRLGPRLKPASPECLAELEAERQKRAANPGPITFSSGDKGPCGLVFSGLTNGITRLNGARTMESLAFGIQAFMDKRVLDRTGLRGMYEMDLEFDYAALRGLAAAETVDQNAGFNIFTAVQEQLGLKLEPRRETMTVLVIDSVALPEAN